MREDEDNHGKEIIFSSNPGVEKIVHALQTTQLDENWWRRLMGAYVKLGLYRKQYHPKNFAGIFLELHINQVIQDLAKTDPSIDIYVPALETPNYFFEPGKISSFIVDRIIPKPEGAITVAEFDGMVLIRDENGSKVLLEVEVKASGANGMGIKSGNAGGGNTPRDFFREYNLTERPVIIHEYIDAYNQIFPDSPLTGHGCLFVSTASGRHYIQTSPLVKHFEKIGGKVATIDMEYEEFAQNAKYIGTSFRNLYMRRQQQNTSSQN